MYVVVKSRDASDETGRSTSSRLIIHGILFRRLYLGRLWSYQHGAGYSKARSVRKGRGLVTSTIRRKGEQFSARCIGEIPYIYSILSGI